MIKSFKNKETERVFRREFCSYIPLHIHKKAHYKLIILDAITSLKELYSPPGNHLKELKGERAGQYSIRVNDQWRICFYWYENNAYKVEIVDYH